MQLEVDRLVDAVEDMKADDPGEAARVLGFCVRDVESGARRGRVDKAMELERMQGA